ncbi:MAG: metallophosphoesterase family protein [Polyangiaceae bacterium]
MILLCVSDIHGRLDALAAILATAERRNFHKLLVAGDLLFPGPQPLETWKRLTAAGAILVQGVTDKAIATLDITDLHPTGEHEKRMLDRMGDVQDELGDLILERLRRLPTHHRMNLEDGRELVLVHGSPADPSEAITHDMSDEEVITLLGDDPADVVVCGMSHVPFDRVVGDVRIINVGSVGEAPDGLPPAGEGTVREPKVAHATWIESTASGIHVEQIVVPLGTKVVLTPAPAP